MNFINEGYFEIQNIKKVFQLSMTTNLGNFRYNLSKKISKLPHCILSIFHKNKKPVHN